MGIPFRWLGALLAAALLLARPAVGQQQDDGWPRCREHKGDLGIAACTALIRTDSLPAPVRAMAFYYRGFAYADTHQADRALADYSDAIRLDPGLAVVYNNRGNIYVDKRDFPRALADYSEALRFNPAFSKAYNNRCVVYLRTGNAIQALADCSEAIRREPDYAHAYMNRAMIYLARGEGEPALADLDAALRFDPASPWTRMYRGAARFILRHYTAAVADLSDSARLMPASATPLLWLHLTLARSGVDDHDILRRKAGKIARSGWPGAALGLYLGEVSAVQARAAAAQGEATGQPDRDCEAAFFIGEDALLRNDAAAAKPLLEQAARDCPLLLYPRAAAAAELQRIAK